MSLYNKRALASSIDENIIMRATSLPRSKPTLISFPKELGMTTASRSNLRLKTLSAPISLDFESNSGPSQQRRSSFLPDALRDDVSRTSNISEYQTRKSSFITPADITLGTAFIMGQRPKEEQKKTMTKFCTGSKYIGEWNQLGMAGKGIYKFPHGVLYDGYFNKKGEFHGSGMLIYPNGQRIEGFWRNGKLSSSPSFVTRDNNVMCDTYCRMPDRRFQIELEKDFSCAGEEYLANGPNPPRPIPKGCYDAGEGFFNPKEKAIFSYKEITEPKDITKDFEKYIDRERLKSYHALLKGETAVAQLSKVKLKCSSFFNKRLIVDIVHDAKEKWIVENCRKAWDEMVGYNPKLYEDWTTGTKTDTKMKNLTTKLQDEEASKMQMTEIAGMGNLQEGERISKVSALMYSFIQTHIIKDGEGPRDPLKSDDIDIGEDSEESVLALSTMFVPSMQKLPSDLSRHLPKDLIAWANSDKDKKEQDKTRTKKLKFKLKKIIVRKNSTLINIESDKVHKIGIRIKEKKKSREKSLNSKKMVNI